MLGIFCIINNSYGCLGIPCRSVTNFESGHDGNEDLIIEVDVEGDRTNDSVWNFHVWNEVWIKNLIDAKMNGWHVCDATPQELSDGVFTCGPTPIYAIKEGLIDQKYDVGFILAEVNADKVFYKMDDNGEKRIIRVDKAAIGKCISTKAVELDQREDITNSYKYGDNSIQEKIIQNRMVETYRLTELVSSNLTIGLRIDDKSGKRNISHFNCDFKSRKNGFLKFSYTVAIYDYRNKEIQKFKRITNNVVFDIKDNEDISKEFDIRKAVVYSYSTVLFEYIKIKALCTISYDDMKEYAYDELLFSVDEKYLTFDDLPKAAKLNTPISIKVKFSNPDDSNVKATKIQLTIGDMILEQKINEVLTTNKEYLYVFEHVFEKPDVYSLCATLKNEESNIVDIQDSISIDD